MGKKLTEAAVKRASAPKTGQVFLWDGDVKGFGVRILPSGSKTFWFQYRPRGGGSSRMVRIDTFPKISVAKARDVAHELAGERARGGNPAADLQADACATRQPCACSWPKGALISTSFSAAASSTPRLRCRHCAAGSLA